MDPLIAFKGDLSEDEWFQRSICLHITDPVFAILSPDMFLLWLILFLLEAQSSEKSCEKWLREKM